MIESAMFLTQLEQLQVRVDAVVRRHCVEDEVEGVGLGGHLIGRGRVQVGVHLQVVQRTFLLRRARIERRKKLTKEGKELQEERTGMTARRILSPCGSTMHSPSADNGGMASEGLSELYRHVS